MFGSGIAAGLVAEAYLAIAATCKEPIHQEAFLRQSDIRVHMDGVYVVDVDGIWAVPWLCAGGE